jgi:hypothetical protein
MGIDAERRAAERRVKFREGMFKRARPPSANEDPEGFIRDVETGVKWQGADPMRLQTLKESAQRQVETQNRQAEQSWEKFYKQVRRRPRRSGKASSPISGRGPRAARRP